MTRAEPVVRPSFAMWQLAHGITPWTVVHTGRAIETIAERLVRQWQPIIDAINEAFAQLAPVVERATQQLAALGETLARSAQESLS